MELDTVVNTILIGLGIFLLVRVVLIYFVAKKLQEQLLVDQYTAILNAPQYQVKGKYE